MDSDTFIKTMLFDFYGELLTEKQREYYDLHYNSDLSLYEIAEQSGTSRQAVWDIIRRADQTLMQAEKKLGFIARSVRRGAMISEISQDVRRLSEYLDAEGKTAAESIILKLGELED